MDRLPSTLSVFVAGTLMMAVTTGCGTKRELEAEAVEVRSRVNAKRAQLRQSEAESNEVGNLGVYNNPKPQHLVELKERIASLKRDGETLAAERDNQAASLKRMEEDLTAYQDKYPPR